MSNNLKLDRDGSTIEALEFEAAGDHESATYSRNRAKWLDYLIAKARQHNLPLDDDMRAWMPFERWLTMWGERWGAS